MTIPRAYGEPYQGPSDWDAICHLLLACQSADPVDIARYPTLWRLRILVMTRLHDTQRDTRIWRNDAGNIIAFAALFRRPHRADSCELTYFVRPDHRESAMAVTVLTWVLARVGEIAHERNSPIECWGDASGQQPADAAMLERFGFTRMEPYVQYMETALVDLQPKRPLPNGCSLRTLGDGIDLDAYLALYNAVSSPLDRDHKEALMWAPEYDSAQDIVIVTSEGELIAFCETSCGRDAWADGRRVGWIDHMGTHPLYRRRGLGEAVMLAGLHRLRATGATTAMLFTASRNAPAQRLYTRLGFRCGATAALYVRDSDTLVAR